MQVRDWMTSNLLTVGERTPIEDAYQLMVQHRIRHLPVLRDKKLVGIVSDRDLAQNIIRPFGEPAVSCVGDIMSWDVLTVGPNDFLTEAASLLKRDKISALPVVQGDDTLVGIVTTEDLLEALVWGLAPPEFEPVR